MYEHLWCGKRSSACGLFLLASVLYIGTLSPTIAWRDSPSLSLLRMSSHRQSAGSPTYALAAKPMTFLPIGSIALRVNLFSALCGALTVSLLFFLLYEILPAHRHRHGSARPGVERFFSACLNQFWRFAEVAEVYALQRLLNHHISLPCCSKLAPPKYWRHRSHRSGIGFLRSCMACVLVCTPQWLSLPRPFWSSSGSPSRGCSGARRWRLVCFSFMLGLAAYLYLPFRSLASPVFNWGDPHTFRQLLIHMSDRKDGALRFPSPGRSCRTRSTYISQTSATNFRHLELP